MRKFITRPDISLYEGIFVKKETDIVYKSENVEQQIKDLKLISKILKKGSNGVNNYETATDLKVYLNEGDILLFEEGRGYYLPSIEMQTIDDGISDMTALKNFDKE